MTVPDADWQILDQDWYDFEHSPLCTPGVVVEIVDNDGGRVKQLVIGHINAELTACPCCSLVSSNVRVTRAKVLWSEEPRRP